MAMDSGHRFRSLMLYHLSDHSEIDMADKGNHTDVTNGLGSAKKNDNVSYGIDIFQNYLIKRLG